MRRMSRGARPGRSWLDGVRLGQLVERHLLRSGHPLARQP